MTALLSGLNMNKIKCAFLVAGSFLLFACSSGVREEYAMNYKGQIGDPIIAIAMLSEQQYEWAGTPLCVEVGSLVVVLIVLVLCKKPLLIVLISTFLERRKIKRVTENLFVKKISKQAI